MLPVASRGISGVVGKPPGKVGFVFLFKKKKILEKIKNIE
jgi:hypothetical protein